MALTDLPGFSSSNTRLTLTRGDLTLNNVRMARQPAPWKPLWDSDTYHSGGGKDKEDRCLKCRWPPPSQIKCAWSHFHEITTSDTNEVILTTASILHNSQEASNETKMDSHLSSKDNENMWTNMSPTVKSRGRELGVRVSVGTAHNCCPSHWEVEAGRGSGVPSELEASLDYMRFCLRGRGCLVAFC